MAAENLIDELLQDAGERMGKSVETTTHEFSTVRTGRASPALLDRVMVDYYGAMTPLNQLATISAPEARLLTVQPYDKSSIKAIEKAINESDVGLTPVQRRQRGAPGGAGAHRGAPPRARQGRAQPRRGGARRDPQRAPRHDAAPARAQGRGRSRPPTTSTAPRWSCRSSPTGASASWTACSRPRKRRSSRSDGRRGRRRRPRAPIGGLPPLRRDHHRRQRPLGAARGLPVNDGHSAGADTVKARLRDAAELGIEELTVYSFSTENWTRPAEEVQGLMEMFSRAHRQRDARAARRRRAHALHRPPRGHPASA